MSSNRRVNLLDQSNQRAIAINKKADLIVGASETATIGAILAMFTSEGSKQFLHKTGHYYLFSAAGLLNLVRTGLVLRQAKLEGGKNGTKEKAILEAASSAAVVVAIAGGFADAPYAKFAPLIFTGMLSTKTLFHAGSTAYYAGKAAATDSLEEKEQYKHVSKANGVATTLLGVTALAIIEVMAWGEEDYFPVIGLVACTAATLYQAYNAYQIKTPTVTIEELGREESRAYEPPMPRLETPSVQEKLAITIDESKTCESPKSHLNTSAGIYSALSVMPSSRALTGDAVKTPDAAPARVSTPISAVDINTDLLSPSQRRKSF